MSITVCILPTGTMSYSTGGGHLWAYLNWALSLQELGVRVIWLEYIDPETPIEKVRKSIPVFKDLLARYGLGESLAIGPTSVPGSSAMVLDFAAATEADLLLNFRYTTGSEIIGAFRRTALVDIDPGLLQIWISKGWLHVAEHDTYFTIGETVGSPAARFPDAGLSWQYTPPCVALDWWPLCPAPVAAPFTTVTHWYGREWVEENGYSYSNDKRDGFLPFLDLPYLVRQPMELAAFLAGDETERALLESKGWRVIESKNVTATPWDYQTYLQNSLGEFSCAKPSCVRLQNAWVSDRTICYLASGKPAVVQDTGPSRLLPNAAGMFRFSSQAEAVQNIEKVIADYPTQCRLARMLAEEFFDGHKVVRHVLQRALS